MAEWSIAAVLKTVDCNRSGGSNPSLSANKPAYLAGFLVFTRFIALFYVFLPVPYSANFLIPFLKKVSNLLILFEYKIDLTHISYKKMSFTELYFPFKALKTISIHLLTLLKSVINP